MACRSKAKPELPAASSEPVSSSTVELIVLGTLQDGGAPHLGCKKTCCTSLLTAPNDALKVTALGMVDHVARQYFLFEASPDIAGQVGYLQAHFPQYQFSGIFLTHAHIGHYSGLLQLGREAMNSREIPVYTMPRMANFLKENGPWDQLLKLKQIKLMPLANESVFPLNDRISVMPLQVPHRDEYSETVGFKVSGPEHSFLFIPDIDKWERWDTSIISLIKSVDRAYLDGTFFSGAELNNRDMSEIPHPSIEESISLFKDLSDAQRSRIHFIHLNHTNPVLSPDSKAYQSTLEKGFNVAQFADRYEL